MWFAASGGFTHWDGTAVTTTRVPFLDGDAGWITDMAATGAADVWAVGHRAGKLYKTPGDGPGEHTQGVLPVGMHWDGSAWVDLSVPDYPGRTSELRAVSAKDGEIWAVGHFEQKLGERDTGNNLPDEVLHQGAIAIKWDGERWVKVGVEGLGSGDVSLEDVQVLGPERRLGARQRGDDLELDRDSAREPTGGRTLGRQRVDTHPRSRRRAAQRRPPDVPDAVGDQ